MTAQSFLARALVLVATFAMTAPVYAQRGTILFEEPAEKKQVKEEPADSVADMPADDWGDDGWGEEVEDDGDEEAAGADAFFQGAAKQLESGKKRKPRDKPKAEPEPEPEPDPEPAAEPEPKAGKKGKKGEAGGDADWGEEDEGAAADEGAGDDGADPEAESAAEAEKEPPKLAVSLDVPKGGRAPFDELWAQRRGFIKEMDPSQAKATEKAIFEHQKLVDVPSLPVLALAAVREGRVALEGGDKKMAVERGALARKLAPSLSEPAFFHAWALVQASPGKVGLIFDALGAALANRLMGTPDARSYWGNVVLVILLGVGLGGLLFVGIAFARRLGLFTHDFNHLFPGKVGRLQTGVIAASILLAPLLLRAGIGLALLVVALAAWLYLELTERIITVVAVGLVAASPLAVELVAPRVAFWSTPAADVWRVEHTDQWTEATLRMNERVDAGEATFEETFALARYHKRLGELDAARELYQKAVEASPRSAAAQNNLGVVYYAGGALDEAKEAFQKAVSLDPGLAEGYHNLAKVYFRRKELDAGLQARQRANDLNRDIVEAHPDEETRLNIALADISLTEAQIDDLATRTAGTAGAGDQLRLWLARVVPEPVAPYFPLIAMALLGLFTLARGKLRPSSSCVKCGRPVCKRCDSDATVRVCGQCVNVFEKKGAVPAQTRLAKERAIRRRNAFQDRTRVTLGIVLPGAGHLVADRPVRAIVFLILILIAAAGLWFGTGPVPQGLSLETGLSLGRIVGFGVLAVGTYVFSIKDLFNGR